MKTNTQQQKKNTKNTQYGFLLVEMLVAVFIFSIVMFVSLGAVLTLVDTNKKNQSIKSVVNNLTLVMNGIAKNLAVSTKYYCGEADAEYPGNDPKDYSGSDTGGTGGSADCQTRPESAITFTFNEDANGDGFLDVMRYKYEKTDGNNTGRIVRSIDSMDNYIPVTAPEVKITDLRFYVMGTEPLIIPINGDDPSGDTLQPHVVMVVKGYAGAKQSIKSEFQIQTTVSQRALDAIYD